MCQLYLNKAKNKRKSKEKNVIDERNGPAFVPQTCTQSSASWGKDDPGVCAVWTQKDRSWGSTVSYIPCSRESKKNCIFTVTTGQQKGSNKVSHRCLPLGGHTWPHYPYSTRHDALVSFRAGSCFLRERAKEASLKCLFLCSSVSYDQPFGRKN